MADLMELCQTRDKLIDQYGQVVECDTCKAKISQCGCRPADRVWSEWINVQLFLLHGDQHLASITVPTRIVAAQMAVMVEIEGGHNDQ